MKSRNRVFITGYGIISAFGNSYEECRARFEEGKNGVESIDEYKNKPFLSSSLAVPIKNYEPLSTLTRKDKRTMGRVGLYAVHSAKLALDYANLSDPAILESGRVGVAGGSCIGSIPASLSIFDIYFQPEKHEDDANAYIKGMPHTVPANVAMYFHLKGRLIPTSSACTSSSQAIGYSYEAIQAGKADIMLAGGAEELSMATLYVFDSLYAASRMNEKPMLTPKPFDKNRDGLVIGEGGCFLVLESEESMVRRGVEPIAEIVGFGTTCDGSHPTKPQRSTMKQAIEEALFDAGIKASDIGYVSAHATGTTVGDIEESFATNEVFGEDIAISSLKSYLGHTLGACGSLESIASIMMMRDKRFFPTINLDEVDPECAKLNYLKNITSIDTTYVMNNNFAFGGVNTSLIFKRV